MSVPRGALPQLRAATDPSARGGQLYAPRFVNTGAAVRRPLMGWSLARKPARRLWEVSERETGVPFDVAALARRLIPASVTERRAPLARPEQDSDLLARKYRPDDRPEGIGWRVHDD
jgi:hypothetical protein